MTPNPNCIILNKNKNQMQHYKKRSGAKIWNNQRIVGQRTYSSTETKISINYQRTKKYLKLAWIITSEVPEFLDLLLPRSYILDHNEKNTIETIINWKLIAENCDSYLVRLCNIRKDAINHSNQHPVSSRMPSIFYYGNYIGSLFSHIHKISTTPMWKFNSIDHSCLSSNLQVSNVYMTTMISFISPT